MTKGIMKVLATVGVKNVQAQTASAIWLSLQRETQRGSLLYATHPGLVWFALGTSRLLGMSRLPLMRADCH